MSDRAALVERLCAASRADAGTPDSGLEWPADLGDAWCFSPELLSLHGTPEHDALDESARRRLGRLEALNFFSLNIHGERSLIAGLAQRLWRAGDEGATPYLHHFLEEENNHMAYFGTFCSRYGRIYPDRTVTFPREYAPGEEDVLFFARVLVFEEIVDVYNRTMADDERLHPLVRSINALHHRDESRHLAFGRYTVRDLYAKHSRAWAEGVAARVRQDMLAFLAATWREYYNPSVYQDAGLADPYGLQRRALAATAERRTRIEAPCLAVLRRAGVLPEVEP